MILSGETPWHAITTVNKLLPDCRDPLDEQKKRWRGAPEDRSADREEVDRKRMKKRAEGVKEWREVLEKKRERERRGPGRDQRTENERLQ